VTSAAPAFVRRYAGRKPVRGGEGLGISRTALIDRIKKYRLG